MIHPNKRCLGQKKLLPIVPKMPKPQGSKLRHERSSQRDLREPFEVTVTSAQADSGRILLAYHAEGCPSLCQNLRQMSEVQQHHQTTNKRAHRDDNFVAFCLMGVRHYGPIPDSGKITEVPSGRYKLLYQIGGS